MFITAGYFGCYATRVDQSYRFRLKMNYANPCRTTRRFLSTSIKYIRLCESEIFSSMILRILHVNVFPQSLIPYYSSLLILKSKQTIAQRDFSHAKLCILGHFRLCNPWCNLLKIRLRLKFVLLLNARFFSPSPRKISKYVLKLKM